MSSTQIRRPPASRVHLAPQQGPLGSTVMPPSAHMTPPGDFPIPKRDLGRQTFGAVDSYRRYGNGQSGSIDPAARDFQYVWQDRIQVNPAHEQPRLVFYSGAQPFIRWGLMRRFSRTFMAASPRFQGRWAYVGFIQRHYTERARISGNISAQRASYAYPTFARAPRTIQLGGR